MKNLPERLKKLSLSPIVTLFSIVLYLLPIIIVNFGYKIEQARKAKFKQNNQAIQAKDKLEGMIRGADQYKFLQMIKEGLKTSLKNDFSDNNAKKFLRKSISPAAFSGRDPFTVILIESFSEKTTIMNFDQKNGFGKTQLTSIFSLLYSYSTDKAFPSTKENSLKKMFAHMFGKRMIPEDVAVSCRRKFLPAIINGEMVFFSWDYWPDEKGRIKAYFLIVKNSEAFERLVLLESLKKTNERYSGFIRLYKKDSIDFLTDPLRNFKPFSSLQNDLKKGIISYSNLSSHGVPWEKKLGNLTAFCLQIPNRKWLAVLLSEESPAEKTPVWLFLINLAFFSIGAFIISRKLVYGKWPETSLRTRFLAMISFGVLVPIALLGVVSQFYANAWLKSEYYRLENELQTSILKLELQQHNMESKYRKRFYELLQSEKTVKAFSGWDNSKEPALKEIYNVFTENDDSLPLLGIDLIDIEGKKATLHLEKKFEFSMNFVSSFFHYTLTEIIRNAAVKAFSLKELPESLVTADLKIYPLVYAMLIDRDFSHELDKRRGDPVWFDGGDEKFCYLQNYFLSNNRGFSIQIFFSLKILYDKIFKSSIESVREEFNRCYPAVFIAVDKDNKQRWMFPEKCAEKISSLIENAVRDSLDTDGPIKKYLDNYIVIAEPSRNFPDITIACLASTAEIDEQFYRITLFYNLILIFCFITAFILGYLLYLRIVNPINETSELVRQIGEENYDTPVTLQKRNDEFGILEKEIGDMLIGLKERKQLAAVLSDQALDAIENSTSGKTEIISESRKFTGAALVTDIREFTAITEKFPPENVTSMLNTHFAEMAVAITEHDGKIYKFIGDAIEAVFEVEEGVSEKDTAEKSVKAALDMLNRLEKIRDRRSGIGLFTYKIGIGLDFGNFTAGLTGDPESRLDFAILGQPLKVAAQLEGRSKEVPHSPIVFSCEIEKRLESSHKKVEKLEEGEPTGYYFKELPRIAAETITGYAEACQADEKVKSFSTSRNFSEVSKRLFFALGLSLIFLAFANFHNFLNDRRENENREHLKNSRKFDQAFSDLIEHENSAYFLLENFLCRLSQNLGNSLPKTPDKDLPVLGRQISQEIANYGIEAEKLLVCRTKENLLEVFLNQGNNPGDLPNLKALLIRVAKENLKFSELHTFFDKVNPIKIEHLENYMEKYFGVKTDITFLEDEMTFRVYPFTISNQEKLFFWAPLFNIDPSTYEVDIANGVKSFRQFPPRRSWDMAGIIMARFQLNRSEKAIINEMVNFHRYEGSYIEIFSENGEKVGQSANIPDNLVDCETSQKLTKIGGKNYRVRFIRKLATKDSNQVFFIILWAGFCGFILIWYQTVFQESGFSSSLRRQFSGIILASIIIPASFVFLTVEGYHAIELQNMQQEIQQKTKICIEQTEQLQYLFPPLIADQLEFVCNNKGIKELMSTNSTESAALVRNYLNYHAERFLSGLPCPIQVSQAMILKKDGTCLFNDTSDIQQSSSSSVVEGYGRTVYAGINRGELPNPYPLAQQAKNEMILDAFVHVYRSMFGEKNFASLLSIISHPVIQTAVSSCAIVYTTPVPNAQNPAFLASWMLILADQRAMLRSAAAREPTEIPIFSEVQIKMGHSSFPNRKRRAYFSDTFIRWLGHTGQHIDLVVQNEGQELIVNGQIGQIESKTLFVAFSSLTQIKNELSRTISATLAILLLGMGLSFFMIFIIAEKLLSPLRQMIFQTKLLREQSYNMEIPSETNDELSLLCKAFNQMARQIKEKTLMKSLVSKHAGSLLSDQMQHERARQGFKTERIILFLNIPEIITTLQLGTLDFQRFREQIGKICSCIAANGGDVDKIMGNKLLVFFPDAPHKSAPDVLKLIDDLQTLEKDIGTRIFGGVHCGEVISGLLGLGNQRDFTMIGDPVNVAARIESAAELSTQGSFLFSSEIMALCKDIRKFEKAGSISLKGKKGLFDLYHLKSQNS